MVERWGRGEDGRRERDPRGDPSVGGPRELGRLAHHESGEASLHPLWGAASSTRPVSSSTTSFPCAASSCGFTGQGKLRARARPEEEGNKEVRQSARAKRRGCSSRSNGLGRMEGQELCQAGLEVEHAQSERRGRQAGCSPNTARRAGTSEAGLGCSSSSSCAALRWPVESHGSGG